MIYTASSVCSIVHGELLQRHQDSAINHLLLDSRKVFSPITSLFFALKGPRRDGHQFIAELYKRGVRNFVVSEKTDLSFFPEANFILTDDTLIALQSLAAYHRQQFHFPIIGITGSNGKTIVKEWLYQLLHEEYNIVRSPKSFNSQIGTALSVWQMNEHHTLGIFEAGISMQGEMNRLERIIRPDIGILTNIGEAHSEGFNDRAHKFREKLTLFRNSKVLIGREIDFEGQEEILDMMSNNLEILTWGTSNKNSFIVKAIEKNIYETAISISYKSSECKIEIPFTDDASLENAITCCCVLLHLHIDQEKIKSRMKKLQQVNMRLELKKGLNHCSIINDSYSADLSSLEIALNFLDQQSAGISKTIIISDFLQTGISDEELYHHIAQSMLQHAINRVIGIGDKISHHLAILLQHSSIQQDYFLRTDSFLKQFRAYQFKEEAILVKGARVFEFEKIVQILEQQVHQTVLEINLTALADNLKQYKQQLNPSVKIMAMVKAFAYGSGGAEIAGVLQYHKVDYLGVAYADEGAELREAGITLPIMVMNPEENSFNSIIDNNLEPEIYSFEILQTLDNFLQKENVQEYPVHIEIETGMNRLGFSEEEMEQLAAALSASSSFRVQSVFSHLVSSEDSTLDDFTKQQFSLFLKCADKLKERVGYSFLKHISNSAAIVRHPEMQLDMVRPGIGLYGIDSTAGNVLSLRPVATLKSTIAQIKKLKAGETVGYSRAGKIQKDSEIATIRIGYADGYPRILSNGIGKIWVNGKLAPVIGHICMDMTMVDITGIPDVKEGDEVIVFGKTPGIETLAQDAGTIPYEIMTGISQRVKRIYYEE
ncbi:MAG: bifunctional UDP-N-acetylmuramoyl-tripeptide:D-alanyl-D-alanine ligase/alanine racemase [Bacteroidetes bacterium]|nr:bifunctional UDP-N-acetylmuramoyl-tripeptide:D-alanyl-D-alanine ligase/alanine racemase [Bacteroidota bacterium]MBS1931026.1 bifunctional UDP-N-acetylmuramoyl-tripeptide:D-alanyl-D-alanine ligase/alanine racemase [Bacteroidota bacterium]